MPESTQAIQESGKSPEIDKTSDFSAFYVKKEEHRYQTDHKPDQIRQNEEKIKRLQLENEVRKKTYFLCKVK
jgi:hypothetical protein